VAVALASTPVGIDMEELNPRIKRLYPSFMSQQEIESCDVNNLKDLYYFWCAKEAMYKWFTHKNLDFIADLHVNIKENTGGIQNKYILQLSPIWLDNCLIMISYL
jgi:4'-phosphopantetheinyl transferase EntD